MSKLFRCSSLVIKRFKSSALYVTGDKAQTNFVPLVPFIDFEERLKNRDEVVENIKIRKLALDFAKIEKRWNFYKTINLQKEILEATKTEMGELMGKLKEENKEEEIKKLSVQREVVLRDLKNVKDYAYGIEENAMLAALELPNYLHENTPKSEVQIYTSGDEIPPKSDSHLDIGAKYELINYVSPMCCFLRNEAALFEHTVLNHAKNMFETTFTQFSNSDFARSLIIEGCGIPYLDPSKVFTLAEAHNEKSTEISKLHLVGGASLPSFMAYFAKYSMQLSYLPLKLFAMGRSYQPVDSDKNSLFNLNQESVFRLFMVCTDNQLAVDEVFEQTLEEIVGFYESLGLHFRLVVLPGEKLKVSESYRVSIEMFSNYLGQYVEVGHLSQFDSYLSKRLLVVYSDENKERKFVKIISGNLLSVQKMLGCLIENYWENPTDIISNQNLFV